MKNTLYSLFALYLVLLPEFAMGENSSKLNQPSPHKQTSNKWDTIHYNINNGNGSRKFVITKGNRRNTEIHFGCLEKDSKIAEDIIMYFDRNSGSMQPVGKTNSEICARLSGRAKISEETQKPLSFDLIASDPAKEVKIQYHDAK